MRLCGIYTQATTERADDTVLVELNPVQKMASNKNSLVVSAEQLQALILQDEAEVKRLKLRMEVEAGESRASLFLRITQRQLSVLKYYNELTENALGQRQAQLNTQRLDAYLLGRMLPLGPKIRRAINRHESEMDIASSKLGSGSIRYLQLLEDRNKYSDMAYLALSIHSNNLKYWQSRYCIYRYIRKISLDTLVA